MLYAGNIFRSPFRFAKFHRIDILDEAVRRTTPNPGGMKLRDHTPHFVGLGGTLRAGSSSETAVRIVMGHLESMGSSTEMFAGPELDLPAYSPTGIRNAGATRLIEALRRADGVIIGSPGYHGSISGMLKNVLDYTEDMRDDPDVYLEGRVVGCIVCAAGAQALGTTLMAMRSIVHALRGWPTPLGVGINTAGGASAPGAWLDSSVQDGLQTLAVQAMDFASRRIRAGTQPRIQDSARTRAFRVPS